MTLRASISLASHTSFLIPHTFLKCVRAVRANGELQLKEKLIDRAQIAVLRVAQLRAKLAELRRPERECRRDAFVAAKIDVVGAIDANSGEPALPELIIERRVEAVEIAREIGAIVDDPFEARDE